MDKEHKTKTSTKSLKANVIKKRKEYSIQTSRTPKQRGTLKNPTGEKLKSIPVMTYGELEYSNFSNEKALFQSFFYNSKKRMKCEKSENDSQVMNRLTDRKKFSSKESTEVKKKPKKKKEKKKNDKEVSKEGKQEKNNGFNDILNKTKYAIDDFKKREKEWKKQRLHILKEIQKYKVKEHKSKSPISLGFGKMKVCNL